MKTITILSGKGGVGKSSITASLGVALAKKKKIICADCDVDASNLALVLGVKEYENTEKISTNKKVLFDLDKCTSCRKCFESCYFDAISWDDDKPKLKEFSCEGCGVCSLVCPSNAITEINVNNATIGDAKTDYGFSIVSAQLGVGESGSGKVVTRVRKKSLGIGKGSDYLLIDSSAGIGCPVIASVTGSDYAVIVTEPTPSGFSDMKKAVDIVKHFDLPFGIIINKHDLNPEYEKKIERFTDENSAEILARFPYDKRFVKALVNLTPAGVYDKEIGLMFEELSEKIINVLDK